MALSWDALVEVAPHSGGSAGQAGRETHQAGPAAVSAAQLLHLIEIIPPAVTKSLNPWPGFPGGAVVKNPPANAGDTD